MVNDIFLLKKKNLFYQNKRFKFTLFFSPIIVIPSVLVVLSSFLIQSVQRQFTRTDAINHFVFGCLGYLIAILISYIPLQRIKSYVIPAYFLSLLCLSLLYLFGISVYGAQRWLSFGLFTFQPSEIAKLSTLLILALVLDKNNIQSIKDLFLPFVLAIIPWTLIFFQPDLGTSLVLIFLFFVMIYWAQAPVEWILIVFLSIGTAIFSALSTYINFVWIPFIGFLAYKSFKNKKIFTILTVFVHTLIANLTPFLWDVGLKDYQKNRLILFLDPSKAPFDGGYHLIQSKIAIGSGGFFGTGFLNGKLTNLKFIPEQHTDFIFSALGEELGFVGSCLVVSLFLFLIIKLINIAKNARSDFESLVVIGIASIFLFQIIINIYMTVGLGPVTGIPLPFMSYGRTSLIINFICIGLALSTLKRSRSLRS